VGGLLSDIRQILPRPTPVLRDRPSNDVSQILRRAILVVMATKFEIIAYNSVSILRDAVKQQILM